MRVPLTIAALAALSRGEPGLEGTQQVVDGVVAVGGRLTGSTIGGDYDRRPPFSSTGIRRRADDEDEGEGNDEGEDRIVSPQVINGVPAPAGRYGYYVGLYYRATDGDGDSVEYYFCGGSLVAPRVVLTAAHCLANKVLDKDGGTTASVDVFVRLDDRDLFNEYSADQVRTADAIILHPDFDVTWLEDPSQSPDIGNDLALVFLDGATPSRLENLGIAPVRLGDVPTSGGGGGGSADLANRTAGIVGHGVYEQTPAQTVSYPLLEGEVAIDHPDDCAIIQFDDTFCTGPLVGSDRPPQRTCSGDSGGPVLLLGDENGSEQQSESSDVQVGVVSYGLQDAGVCLEDLPGGSTLVSYHRGWIDDTVASWGVDPASWVQVSSSPADDPLASSPGPSPSNNATGGGGDGTTGGGSGSDNGGGGPPESSGGNATGAPTAAPTFAPTSGPTSAPTSSPTSAPSIVVPCPKKYDEFCNPSSSSAGGNCCLADRRGKKSKSTLKAGESLERGEWLCRPEHPRYAFGLLSGSGTVHLLRPVHGNNEDMCEVVWTAENGDSGGGGGATTPPSGHKLHLEHDGRLVLRDHGGAHDDVERWTAGCGGGSKPKLKMSRVRDDKGESAKVIHLSMRSSTNIASHRRKLGKKKKNKKKKKKATRHGKIVTTWWLNTGGGEIDRCYN